MSSDVMRLSEMIAYCIDNPGSCNSEQYLTSPYNINTWPNIKAMRIVEMITKDEIVDV